MTTPARISPDVLARYAADAARDVDGVRELVPSRVHRHDGVRVKDGDEIALEVHVSVDTRMPVPDVGRNLQQRIAEYLERMTGTAPATVDVVVHAIGR